MILQRCNEDQGELHSNLRKAHQMALFQQEQTNTNLPFFPAVDQVNKVAQYYLQNLRMFQQPNLQGPEIKDLNNKKGQVQKIMQRK